MFEVLRELEKDPSGRTWASRSCPRSTYSSHASADIGTSINVQVTKYENLDNEVNFTQHVKPTEVNFR